MSKKCKECQHCQQVPISAICVEIESENYSNIKEFQEDVEERLVELEKPHEIDSKTLSSCGDDTRDQIIQSLVDKVLALEKQQSSNNTVSSESSCFEDVDWSYVGDCSNMTCSEKLQALVNTVYLLKQQVDEL